MGGPAGAAYGAASAGSRAYGYAKRGDGVNGADPGSNGTRRDYDFEGSAEEIEGDDPQLRG
jgi:hypothetical protein